MKRLKRTLLVWLLLLGVILSACAKPAPSGETPPPDASQRVIRYAIGGAWDSLMPYGSVSGSNYARIVYDKIYDRPAFIHADGSLSPRAATGWETLENGYAIRFTLDERARFHDGTPVTATHWLETFQIVTNPLCHILGRSTFAVLTGTDEAGSLLTGETLGVTVEDEYTFTLHLKKPMTAEDFLLGYGRELYVLPTHILHNIPAEELVESGFWRSPVGSGPCVFAAEVVGSSLTLRASAVYQFGCAGFDRLEIQVIDKANHLSAFLSGDIDYFAFGNAVSNDNLVFAEAQGLTVVKSDAYTNFFELMLNNESLDDANLRKAIDLAIDKSRLADYNAGDLGVVAGSYLLPGIIYPSLLSVVWAHDVLAAQHYLADSAYNGEALTLAVTAPRSGLAALIQQDLAAAGITAEIVTVDSAALFAGMAAGDFDMAIASHTPSALPLWFVEPRFTSDGGVFRTQDENFRLLIGNVSRSVTEQERAGAMVSLLYYLEQETPFVPLFFTKVAYTESKTVSGIEYTASSFSNENVWAWERQP